MNYKDQEYEQFMQNMANGSYQVLEVSLREWESVSSRRTLKSTSGEERYDHIFSNAIEYIYQVEIRFKERDYLSRNIERIEFGDDQKQAEKVYEQLVKSRASAHNN